uniref:THAP-type domain-containing protein n=1 Tax=Esox lucius TaxID=8010 RepID=A0A3P8Z4R2_ESOLU
KTKSEYNSKGNKCWSDVSLHCFPHEKIRKQWEVACGRVQLPKDPWLCSRHFSPDAFEAFSQLMELTGAAGYKRRLKPNAVPSIFSHKELKLFMCCDTRSICKYNQSILF